VHLIQEIEKMRAEQNAVSDKITQITDGEEKKRVIDEMRALKEKMQVKKSTRGGDARVAALDGAGA
jgi:seryl-tRNA synthetase